MVILSPDNIKSNSGEEQFTASYLGRVEDIKDPLYEGRCRVRVFSLFDDIPVEDLPWAVPYGKPTFFGQDARAGSISIPKVGAIVRVKFNNGDIYSPEYSQVQEIGDDIKQELRKGGKKYEGAHFILFDGDEEIKFWFDQQVGLQIELKKSFIRIDNETSNILVEHKDNLSSIALEGNVIRIVSDSEVQVTTGSKATITAKTVHIKGNNTILGSSIVQNSAVLGEPLFAVLKILATAIDAKIPATAGAIAQAVEAAKPMVLSRSVTVGKF
jgi:Type VI secretion system/phage-baseplate injector OB domain